MRLFRSTSRSAGGQGGRSETLRCSFCGKTHNQVSKLIAGPTVFICNECVGICNEIIADDAASRKPRQQPGTLAEVGGEPELGVWCSLCRLLVPATGCLLVPGRGQICAGCLEAVKSAAEEAEDKPGL